MPCTCRSSGLQDTAAQFTAAKSSPIAVAWQAEVGLEIKRGEAVLSFVAECWNTRGSCAARPAPQIERMNDGSVRFSNILWEMAMRKEKTAEQQRDWIFTACHKIQDPAFHDRSLRAQLNIPPSLISGLTHQLRILLFARFPFPSSAVMYKNAHILCTRVTRFFSSRALSTASSVLRLL